MEQREFEQLVADALEDLPRDIKKFLDNVQVTVANQPSSSVLGKLGLGPGHLLFGLYQGVPKTRRSSRYGLVLPDKITIYQCPMERVHTSPAAIRAQVRKTVLHELAHHFGISDQRLRELEVY